MPKLLQSYDYTPNCGAVCECSSHALQNCNYVLFVTMHLCRVDMVLSHACVVWCTQLDCPEEEVDGATTESRTGVIGTLTCATTHTVRAAWRSACVRLRHPCLCVGARPWLVASLTCAHRVAYSRSTVEHLAATQEARNVGQRIDRSVQ